MYYKKKTFIQKVIFSPVFAILLLFFIGYLIFGLISLIGKSTEVSRARKLSENQAAELMERKDRIEGRLARIETRAGEEEIIREQFPVVKEGEQVVVIVPDDTVTEEVVEKKNFWTFLTGWFR